MAEKYKNKKWLKKQYCDKKKSKNQIANEMGVSPGTIYHWVEKYDLEQKPQKYQTKKWLQEHFCEQGLTMKEIAEKAKVHKGTIQYWLEKNDIEREVPKHQDKKWLRKQYEDEEKSAREIGDMMSRSESTIRHWLEKFDIERRDRWEHAIRRKEVLCDNCGIPIEITPWEAEMSKYHFCDSKCQGEWERDNKSGSDSPNWRGGENRYKKARLKAEASWNYNRQRALDRDNYNCELCDSSENLEVHHIKPILKDGKNYIGNLITLCQKCHHQLETKIRAKVKQ